MKPPTDELEPPPSASPAQNRGRPFAFSVDKSDYIFAIHPSLPPAIDSARERFSSPSGLIGISGWFADGTRDDIPYELLCTPDRTRWISAEEARRLEESRYPAA